MPRKPPKVRRFYRVTKGRTAKLKDFRSPIELGRTPREDATDDEREAMSGVSCFDSVDAAKAIATHGRGIAVLELSESDTIWWRKTFGHGHYTVWAPKEALLAAVIKVVPL